MNPWSEKTLFFFFSFVGHELTHKKNEEGVGYNCEFCSKRFVRKVNPLVTFTFFTFKFFHNFSNIEFLFLMKETGKKLRRFSLKIQPNNCVFFLPIGSAQGSRIPSFRYQTVQMPRL